MSIILLRIPLNSEHTGNEGINKCDENIIALADYSMYHNIETILLFVFASNFGEMGNVAYTLRMALGTLIIKEKKKNFNEETTQEIIESRDLQ